MLNQPSPLLYTSSSLSSPIFHPSLIHPFRPVSLQHISSSITMAEAKKDTVVLQTSDDEQFTVERKVAERSALIKSMMEGESPF